ncbi:MAG TPA: bifunctional response regulator/alkaline phosphatase family protein [Bacteroidia bacterium]|nr:bifunctional response regulator/alkaline phosphatase family protein [Bacteroidia bacterium]HRS58801.1 bifunctional response regulator/alkaline phosphatase family protein [Bacteroidia bacterium]HRU68137.1 bifunctional response regulator/alkaline phosphatase family protein [Bacteroidia bacterium]
MSKIKILWADDEIDLLKPHIIFLEQKDYEVVAVTNGYDAIEEIENNFYHIVFLDEKMPGINGLDTLVAIKKIRPELPVVMVTKIEEEPVMNEAIGSQISDYLIKPVNPKQLWLTVKKHTEQKQLVSEKITSLYQQDFRELSMTINDNLDIEGWKKLYRELVRWELELEKSNDTNLKQILDSQKSEANANFFKFISKNYQNWIKNPDSAPLMSNKLMIRKILPLAEKGRPVYTIIIDNFRYDQWKTIQPLLTDKFHLLDDDLYFSILPTATNYSRNAIFSGMMPLDIEKSYPNSWVFDEEKGSKNLNEEKFLIEYLRKLRKNISVNYQKITSLEAGRRLPDQVNNMNGNLRIIIYNFIDLLSHVRTEMEVLKELAEDEAAYRSLTFSWFKNSPLYETIEKIASEKCYLVITTDHGSIRVKRPSRVIGDKNTTTNLRFKQGKNLDFEMKEVLYFKNPADIMLPQPAISSSYIFAREDYYFIYQNNYNYFANYYENTFQHGGVSMEEMMVPIVVLEN